MPVVFPNNFSILTACLALFLALAGCQSPPCGPSSCAGCCDAAGQCQQGDNLLICGSLGRTCDVCVAGQVCQGACVTPSSGGGSGGGAATGGGGGATGGGGGASGGGGGTSLCAGLLSECQGQCVDTLTSVSHCGGCGLSCASGQVCNRGSCDTLPTDCVQGSACPPGYGCDPVTRACVAGCQRDLDCPGGGSCVNNTCECATGAHACGQSCVSDTSPGSCGQSCTACPGTSNGSATCAAAQCGLVCDSGYLLCAGACARCTTPANASPICSGAGCDFACNVGFHRCGSQCLSNTSVASCGSSCSACPSANGTAACNGQQCQLTCNSGFRLCQGACAACTTPANATPTCAASACDFTCNPGFHRCGNQCLPNDSVNSCGSSCTACPSANGTASCTAGACELACNSTHLLCAGACALCTTPANAGPVCNASACDFECYPGYEKAGSACALVPRWRLAGHPLARSGPVMAYDSQRGRVVLFSGATQEWDGVSWTLRRVDNSPSDRTGHAMTYDAARGKVVLFGGLSDTGSRNDVWEWDGVRWHQRTPQTTTKPSATSKASAAYDPVRQRVVLFGGWSGSRDLYQWDGSTWDRIVVATRPEARRDHALAWDPTSSRVILAGGTVANAWAWDGAAWASLGALPSTLDATTMAFDAQRSRMVLVGQAGIRSLTTGEWNGSAWAWLPSTLGENSGALAYDAQRTETILLCSSGTTYRWDVMAADWVVAAPAPARPPPGGELVFDTQRAVSLLVGNADAGTWTWNGTRWTSQDPPVSPPERWEFAMAFDSQRGRAVLYGGLSGTTSLQDTWEWDGTTWLDRAPTATPGSTYASAMAFDSQRGQTVLFGGLRASSLSAQTWVWSGTTWTRVAVGGQAPSARWRHAMAFDAARGRLVLFGGATGSASTTALQDTWEWNGSGWTQLTPTAPLPPARTRHALAWDAARSRVVLYGGESASGAALSDTWEWDGSSWQPLTVAQGTPGALRDPSLAYDSTRSQLVVFNGVSTWEYGR